MSASATFTNSWSALMSLLDDPLIWIFGAFLVMPLVAAGWMIRRRWYWQALGFVLAVLAFYNWAAHFNVKKWMYG